MTVRSALNHESLNTTHSPAPIRVVVEQPASATIASNTNMMVFILVPSPCSFRLAFKDAPASVDIAVSPSKGDAESNMVTGRRFSRIASTIKGSAMTHLRGRVGEKELTSGGPRVSSAEAGHPEISSAHCAVKRVIKLWERILLRRPFHDGCPTGSTGTRRHDHLHERPLMGRVAHIEGLWWQFSLTERGLREPFAVGLVRISRDRQSRGRVLHDSCGNAPQSERADGRCLLARRSREPEHPGRTRRSATC